ncbi:MAG: UDP-3-O-(3-hydroxymyristoyl)glucosamine N-acyltransferase [Terracidiphilus sp.]
MQGEFSLGDLAVRFGLGLRGEPGLRVSRVATLARADAGSLSFLANPRYRKQMEATHATAVLVGPEHAAGCPVAALIDPNPYLAYARIADLLHPHAARAPGIHSTAVVSPGARIASWASVGPLAVIEDDADIGERAFVGPGCVVQRGAQVGADSCLVSRVNLYAGVRIGRRCIVHAGAVIGADGFGFASDAGSWVKVPQVGSVQVGDDVEIGANTTIDRGAIDDTVVEDGVKLDNQIQVGHNVTIGAHTAVAGCVGISGSTSIGRRCMIGGGVGIAGHLTIADDVVVTGCSLVSASIRQAGSYSSGMPTVETRLWRRMVAHLRRLDVKER